MQVGSFIAFIALCQFGQPLYAFEVLIGEETPNAWPLVPRVLAAAHDAEQTSAADFAGGSKDPDEEIYALAEQRFETALKQQKDSVADCLKAVRRALAAEKRRQEGSRSEPSNASRAGPGNENNQKSSRPGAAAQRETADTAQVYQDVLAKHRPSRRRQGKPHRGNLMGMQPEHIW